MTVYDYGAALDSSYVTFIALESQVNQHFLHFYISILFQKMDEIKSIMPDFDWMKDYMPDNNMFRDIMPDWKNSSFREQATESVNRWKEQLQEVLPEKVNLV